MTDDVTTLAAGDFAFDPASRRLRGMLIPFNEASRMNPTGQVGTMFTAADIDLPRDPMVMTLNRHHNRHDPVGRGDKLEVSQGGVIAEFVLADTDEADQWLREQSDPSKPGALRKLSAEVLFHADGKRARLTGAALVTDGAFQTAGLFAMTVDSIAGSVDGLTISGTLEQPEPTTDSTTEPTTGSPATTEKETPAMTTSIVPDASAVAPLTVDPNAADFTQVDTGASALFSALADQARTGNRRALAFLIEANNRAEASGLFAAYAPLNDITATAAAATFPPQFLGEVYKKDEFVQTVAPLFLHDDLTALTVSGWAWIVKPTVGAYAGDKAAVPTNTPTFGPVTTTAERIAGAHDVDRALRDFGNEAFWSSYFRIMVEEYKKLVDAKVLAKISAAAPVVAPAVVTGTQDPGTMALIDGALAVIAAGYTPTFALVSAAIFRSFLVTPKDKVLEYLSSSMGLTEGQLGSFKIVPNGTLAAKRVIVGSRQAATVYELPGAAPIRVEGLDVAHAGIDPAVYGYCATLINDASALASVTTL